LPVPASIFVSELRHCQAALLLLAIALPLGACHSQAAASPREAAQLRGVTIRALGQEPGWVLEVVPRRWVHMRGDYGAFDILTSVPEPFSDGDALVYESGADENALRLRLYQRPCQDSMSGKAYPLTAVVHARGRQFDGCAESL
jgi:uncharacterized membrane protein